MPLGSSRLSLLAFPQSWDGASLLVRFLCLPRGVPVEPLAPGLPDFASANVVLSARLVAGLERLPVTAAAADAGVLALENPPADKAALFEELANQFDIVPRVPPAAPPAMPRILKATTASYERLAGTVRRYDYLRAGGDYECALQEKTEDEPNEPARLEASLTWGKVIAHALRQPRLAEGLGLIGQATVTPPNADFFARGGWLYFDLDAASDYAGAAGLVAQYAARIPPLSTPRAVFAPVLFPVDAPAAIVADEVFREAELYDTGLARLVHGAQLTARLDSASLAERGDSIQLAWDDEQIAIWFNRQMQRKADGELVTDALFGIAGYRIDVRKAGDLEWHSLLRIESQGSLQLGDHDLGAFVGESVVEAVPAKRASAADAAAYWLPPYFACWRGRSLALTDPDLVALHAGIQAHNPAGADRLLNREKTFLPVDDAAVPLRYGTDYEFRVRLADLTRGGPDWETPDRVPPGLSIAAIDFRRRTPPGPILVLSRPGDEAEGEEPPGELVIEKPRLGYPEALFAGAAFADLAADADVIAADDTITREPGVFDPFVVMVEIAVEVKALAGDRVSFLPLYRTTRLMPADTLSIELAFQDVATLAAIDADQPGEGPLLLPTAREVKLTLAAMGAADDDRFYDAAARAGTPVFVHLRREAATEVPLLSEPAGAATVLQSFYFQPPGAGDVAPIQRLAGEVGLDQMDLSLAGRAGRRTVIGASAALRHTLSPERSSITVASGADLLLRWINVVRFTLDRDWTWDGLTEAGMTVMRTIRRPGQPANTALAGTLKMPHALALKALPEGEALARAVVRQSTDLVFVDAIDPTADAGRFPTELSVEYTIQPAFVAAPAPDPVVRSTLLPITTPPSQLPRIVSAGIALSPYVRADDYSSTAARERVLWFEFAEPPAEPDDAYFVRVLGVGPDPLLLEEARPLPEEPEPGLPIDPEAMRRIVPGQPRDSSGLAAARLITESPRSARHFVVPIPDDLTEASPELFGFFVYEVRLGHTDARWSTAQGRFGPALRIAGVQHPAPALECQAARGDAHVMVRAPFATPVHAGRNLRPRSPRSQLWALLYARVRQFDTAAWRNVLIARTRLVRSDQHQAAIDARDVYGEGHFPLPTVKDALSRLGLPADAPLTVLTAEMFGEPVEEDPLGAGLGRARILRVSPLVPVPEVC